MLPLVQAQLCQEGLAFQGVLVYQVLPVVKESKTFFSEKKISESEHRPLVEKAFM